jgi:hypothetical protein
MPYLIVHTWTEKDSWKQTEFCGVFKDMEDFERMEKRELALRKNIHSINPTEVKEISDEEYEEILERVRSA